MKFGSLLSILLCLGLFCHSFELVSQNRVRYSFSGCSLKENNQKTQDISAKIPAQCDCGIEQEAIVSTGQTLLFPKQLDSFFFNDFSLCFTVNVPIGPVAELDLFTKSWTCNGDTVLHITYRGKDSLFVFNLREGFDESIFMGAKAQVNKCWQQICLIKKAGIWRVFLNGELADQETTNDLLRLDNGASLTFNGSDCQTKGVLPLAGKLDEVIIADYAFGIEEVKQIYKIDQEILTPDTIVFLGEDVLLRSVLNCKSTVSWTPSANLTTPDELNTIARPSQTTTYTLTMISPDGCRAIDTVLVRVVDKNKLDCAQLRLPTAFTPNQDGINDLFFISNAYIIDRLDYFEIHDRNGGTVAAYNSPTGKWDGTWNGKTVDPGVYFYRIAYTCKNEEYKKDGSFYLLK